MNGTMRMFLAIDLSPEVRSWLGNAKAVLSDCIPSESLRWMKVEAIHITLKFLGDTPSQRIDDIRTVMDSLARGRGLFPLVVEGLGCFPNPSRPRVIWAGIRRQPILMDLHKHLEGELEQIGFPRERRPFSPHLTLGRVRNGVTGARSREIGAAVKASIPPAAAGMDVKGWCLYRSILRPSGAEYSVLHRTEFTG